MHSSIIYCIKIWFCQKRTSTSKIFLRTLLFSTGKRGNVVENLFLRVKGNNNIEEFSFWGHGDTNLTRGSGLYVNESGIVTNHHFNPVNAEKLFLFKKDKYEIELVAKIIGKKKLKTLSEFTLIVPSDLFEKNISQNDAIYFNWSDEKNEYIVSIENR